MDEMNYGKYSIPQKLKQMVELQQQLNEAGQLKYGDILDYYFSYTQIDDRYLNTPLDVIPFARPGIDGVHFGFLTDFSQAENLEDVYIVRVSPMDFDNPVHIVARNIEDFLSAICFHPNSMNLLDMMSTHNEVSNFLDNYPALQKEMIYTNPEYAIQRIVYETFQLEPFKNFESYFELVQRQRKQEVIVRTLDHIGVTQKHNTSEEISKNFKLMNLENKEQLTLSEVKSFFETAAREEKLAFLRDGYTLRLIWDQEEIKSFLKEQLYSMELTVEAERIFFP